jgi:hypothetical protein
MPTEEELIEDEDDEPEIVPDKNKITENIDSLIDKLPQKIISKPIKNNTNDVLLKIDINKLGGNINLSYR